MCRMKSVGGVSFCVWVTAIRWKWTARQSQIPKGFQGEKNQISPRDCTNDFTEDRNKILYAFERFLCQWYGEKLLAEPKSICPMHSEAKQYENISIWSREEFTAEPGGSCLKNSRTSWKPFYRQGEGGVWLVVANLVSEPLFLRSGHNVPVKLHPSKCCFRSDKKGQGSKHQSG